jgi:hypothetical protein
LATLKNGDVKNVGEALQRHLGWNQFGSILEYYGNEDDDDDDDWPYGGHDEINNDPDSDF